MQKLHWINIWFGIFNNGLRLSRYRNKYRYNIRFFRYINLRNTLTIG